MPMIPFVRTGYIGTSEWAPFVNGYGLTAGGGEPEPPAPTNKVGSAIVGTAKAG